ncbi:Hpt domain-containing protein [Sphingomonas abietis]|uniref:Hpt domain-containing protein n=1 Tax=Sphingomonas abietis TaxID=3012344 RepID=A0ABY7NPR4_9SPHN|nr:Hpt domain-containing protein [Sphingomonas abietis]WBO23373.1 Hpt domain-containing protein [Sphingomonas abietis]
MAIGAAELVDWGVFARVRAELGSGFVRILGYFREDGIKSVGQIEQAIRDRSAAALVLPAHTLKGEARQFGAAPLAELAEIIETTARRCVEARETPDELIEQVVELRPLFDATLKLFDREVNPIVERRPAGGGFGRKPAGGFGMAQR